MQRKERRAQAPKRQQELKKEKKRALIKTRATHRTSNISPNILRYPEDLKIAEQGVECALGLFVCGFEKPLVEFHAKLLDFSSEERERRGMGRHEGQIACVKSELTSKVVCSLQGFAASLQPGVTGL